MKSAPSWCGRPIRSTCSRKRWSSRAWTRSSSILAWYRCPDFASPAIHLTGDGSRRQRANIISTDVSSVREYTAGDSVSRIHWLSTARVNQLMVKQFDRGSASHVWVLFDQHRDSQAGRIARVYR